MPSSRNAELRLLLSLRGAVSLNYLGCRFDRGLVGGVIVSMADMPLGAWWYEQALYCYSTTAYQRPRIAVETIGEACEQTHQLATQRIARETVNR